MTQIIIETPDDKYDRFLVAISTYFGYSDLVPDPLAPEVLIPNPEDRETFLSRGLSVWLVNIARDVEINTGASAFVEQKQVEIQQVKDELKIIAGELAVEVKYNGK